MNREDLPLRGLRVVDFTLFWAGPLPSAMFADLGAEVVKVESIQHLDPFRAYGTPADPTKDKNWERSPLFNALNRNKRGVTLDLTVEDGRQLFRDLVRVSDVVLQNYSPRVLPQLELGWQRLAAVNPRIVLTSVSGFGQDGPWRDYVSFAAIGEALSGVSSLTGYEGEGPVVHGVGLSDPYAGLVAAFTTLAAVHSARRTGKGTFIDATQLESTIPFLADAFLDWSLNGRRREATTNDHPSSAPHGAFPASGDDQWITVSVATEREWTALVDVLGSPAWAREPRFATPLERWRNRRVLCAHLAEWTRTVDKNEGAALLQARGVPAAPVRSPAEQIGDPGHRASGFFQQVDHPLVGTLPYSSFPARIDGEYPPIARVGPRLGEDNRYVLGTILGRDEREIARLEAAQVIGTEPATAR
jgi:crotonobetainyl-CoA:carnitine CoA-transferase CaiB-like acyl-CoA transferase